MFVCASGQIQDVAPLMCAMCARDACVCVTLKKKLCMCARQVKFKMWDHERQKRRKAHHAQVCVRSIECPINTQKRPVYAQKRPIYAQKRPINNRRKAHHAQIMAIQEKERERHQVCGVCVCVCVCGERERRQVCVAKELCTKPINLKRDPLTLKSDPSISFQKRPIDTQTRPIETQKRPINTQK